MDKTGLSESQLNMIRRVEEYDISFVLDKLVTDKSINVKDTSKLEIEFKKFIILAGLKVYPIAMISPLVDEVWHQFILFTKQYKDFCINTVGYFINHVPDTPLTPIPTIAGENLRQSYKQYFGDLAPIWYKNMNQETKKYFMQNTLIGKPPTKWSGWIGDMED